MKDIVVVNSRQEFLEQVDRFLSTLQFAKDGDIYTRNTIIYAPGIHMIINGHIIDQPGPSCPIRFQIESVGQGDIDGDKFDVLAYSIWADCDNLNNFKYVCGRSYGFYYNDFINFKQFTLKAFQII